MEIRPRIGSLVAAVIVQGVVGVVLLVIFRLVVDHLPMLQEVDLPLYFGLSELLAALISTGIVAVLMSTAGRLALQVDGAGLGFTGAGLATKLLAALGSLLLIYHSYSPLLQPYLGQYEWIYQVVFLTAFLATLVALGYTVYTGVGDLGATMAARPRQARMPGAACGQCGAANPPGGAFCDACGAAAKPAGGGGCASCGTPLKAGSRFCPDCGAPGPTPGVVKPFPPRPAPPAPATVACASCGAPLRPGARFCANCGTATEKPTAAESPAGAGEAEAAEEPPVVPACGSCGAPLRPGTRFCGKCGSPHPG